MMRRLGPPVLLLLLSTAAAGQTSPLAGYDETTLRQAGVGTDAASLLKLLHEHTRNDGDPRKIADLIARLGDGDFEKRERAARDLIALGRPALDALRKARKTDPDPEIRLRAGHCIDGIESSLDGNVAFSAVRRLLHLRADGAAGPLLALLPDADSETQDEIVHGLARVALRDGKLDPTLLAALDDKTAERRAAAVLAVALAGGPDERARVRKRLTDADPHVRLRAAQGLLAVRDVASLPVLIALLNETSVEIAWPAEELLHWVAGDSAPAAKVGGATDEERKKAVTGWTDWHKTHAATLDWDQIEQSARRPGLYFVCESNRVWLCGCDGKVRWNLSNAYGAHDVVLLPNNQLLVAMLTGDGLLVRCDLKGKELWKHADRNGNDPICCQRLANGNLFYATEEQMFELSAAGEQLAAHTFTEFNPGDAWKMRNGRIVCRHEEGVAVMDGFTGHILRDGPLEKARFSMMNKFAVLPDGRCVVADHRQNRVIEVDRDGKTLNTVNVRGAWSVEALRNGNYVVCTRNDLRIMEIDPAGRTLWEAYTRTRPMRVRTLLDKVRIGFDKPRPADFDLDSAASRIRRLKDADPLARRRAAIFLAYLKPTDETSIAAIIAALDDSSPEVRTQVSETLAQIGPPAIPQLVNILKKGTANGRAGAATALSRMGPAAKVATPELIELVKDARNDTEVRRAAAATLGSIGPDAKAALSVLLDALKGNDETVRRQAATSLSLVAPTDPAVVPALVVAMKDARFPDGQYAAVSSLAHLGVQAKDAVPDLLAIVKATGERQPLRETAVNALGNMGAEGKSAVPPLLDILKDSKQPESFRCIVAQTLGRFGPESKAALPLFGEMLGDPKLPAELSNAVVQGLGLMGKDGIPTLAEAVMKGNALTRRIAINQLSSLGDVAKPALPALKEAAKDPDRNVSLQATRAIRIIEQGGVGRGKLIGDE